MTEILMARLTDIAAGSIANIVEDLTPQLGGNLDGQTFNITTTGTIGALTADFDQSSLTGAVPVLYLDQADLSEEFIRFDATAASGVTNPISTDVSESDAPAGYLRININGTDRWLRFYADTD